MLYRIRSVIRTQLNKLLLNHNDLVISQQKNSLLNSEKIEFIISVLTETNRIDFEEYFTLIPKKQDKIWFNEWPGEHYKLLAGICKVKKPKIVIEIGTWRGLSALALSLYSKSVISYDILGLDTINNSIYNLVEKHPNITQIIGDLSEESFYNNQAEGIRSADIIFIDGPKNYIFEKIVINKLLKDMRNDSILIIDDIRFANMIELWEEIKKPKIDLAEFGHFTGTGLVFI